MKSRKLRKVIISSICVLSILFLIGCSSDDGKSSTQQASSPNKQQTSTAGDKSKDVQTSSDSEDTKSSEQAANAPVLVGRVSAVDGGKITIAKVSTSSNGTTTSKKKNAPMDKQDLVTIEIGKSVSVIIRTPLDKNNTKFDDKEGAISNIKEDSFVEVWGSKDGKNINANKVIIYETARN